MTTDTLVAELGSLEGSLRSYLRRLLLRPDMAEDIVQTTAVRALEARSSAPSDAAGLRRWLFTIATRLALDERRRHSSWREKPLEDVRAVAEGREDFVARARAWRGCPEMAAIAREHLAFCFSCVLRNLEIKRGAALLLKEVMCFSVAETAEILEASFGQAKNWIQEARAEMERRYADSCALLNKRGVCYQCVELDGFFNGGQRNPLEGTDGSVDARVALVRDLKHQDLNAWHKELLGLLDELEGSPRSPVRVDLDQ